MIGSVFQYFQKFLFVRQDIFKEIKVIDINHCDIFLAKIVKKEKLPQIRRTLLVEEE
jgi:hypothetical protein